MFTEKFVKALPPRDLPYREYEGGNDKGFGIQVSKSAKTFFVQYKSPVAGKRRFMNLGAYPDTTLAKARERCRQARSEVDGGKDPQIERDADAKAQLEAQQEAERQAELDKATGTVDQLFGAYIGHLKAKGTKTYRDVQNLYERDIKKAIGKLKARDITVDQVHGILKAIFARGAKIRTNRARSYMMAAFSYGIKSDFALSSQAEAKFRLTHNPVRDIPVPAEERPGERYLSAAEMQTLWQRLDESNMSHASKTILRVLLATGGQRVQEVIGMRWSELDFDRKVWELSSARTKNNRPHVVPLSDLAIDLIKTMQPIANDVLVFPHRKHSNEPYVATSLGRAIKRFCDGSDEREGFPAFTPRDIRRTVKTRMGELGITKEVRDRLQNHALHDVSSKHYDRYDYFEPKKRAMDVWTRWLLDTIEGWKATNVVSITAGAKSP